MTSLCVYHIVCLPLSLCNIMDLVVSMFVTFSSIRNFIGLLPFFPFSLVTEIEHKEGALSQDFSLRTLV